MDELTRSEILKTIPYGFYVTGVVGSDAKANGFTTCWVSQVSFEPQQVVAVRKDQHTHDLIEEGGVFSLNLLDTEQGWAEEWAKEVKEVDWQKLLSPRGFQVLPCRWVVDRSFAWLCHNRRMSKDYERLCATGEAFVYAAMIRFMVRRWPTHEAFSYSL
jgi:hypothetical protein